MPPLVAPLPIPHLVVVLATTIAVMVNTVFVWPQAWRIMKGRTEGVSPATWVLSVGVGTVWTGWAYASHNFWLLFVNVSSTVAALIILVSGARQKAWRRRWWMVGAAIILSGVFASQVVPLIVVPFVLVSGLAFRLPQLVKALRSSDVSGISQTTWTLATINPAAWLIVSLARADAVTAAANIIAILSSIILLAVVKARARHTGADAALETVSAPTDNLFTRKQQERQTIEKESFAYMPQVKTSGENV